MERVNERKVVRFASMRRLFSDPSYIVTLVIGVTGAVLTFFLFSLPILRPASQLFPSLGSIWQQGGYRIALIVVMLKLCTPLLVLLFAGCCLLLWHMVRRYREAAEQDTSEQPFISPFAALARLLQQAPAKSRTTSGGKEQASTLRRPTPLRMATPALRRQMGGGDKKGTSSLSARALRLKRKRLLQLRGRVKRRDHHTKRPSSPASFSPPTVLRSVLPFRSTVGGEKESPPTGLSSVSITLLKDISLVLHAPDGRDWPVLLPGATKRILLLAYLACQRDGPVSRERILVEVFGHGLPVEQASPGKLSEQFDSHKKYLRADIRGEIARINALVGYEVFPAHLDILAHRQIYWALSADCRVVDLDEIEAQHQVIAQAKADGTLVEYVPHTVQAACERLIAGYTGDVLASLISDYPEVFEPWAQSWVRQPFTLYRDFYLQALWYAAEHERLLGMQQEERQALHFGRSAELYWRYAMHACSSKLDARLAFDKDGRQCHGERVILSERALGRSLLLYGAIGETRRIDSLFTGYYNQMRHLSQEVWEPGLDLLADQRNAHARPDSSQFERYVVCDTVPALQEHLTQAEEEKK